MPPLPEQPAPTLTRSEPLAALHALSSRALRGASLEESFRHAVEAIVSVMPAERAAIFETRREDDGDILTLRAGKGWDDGDGVTTVSAAVAESGPTVRWLGASDAAAFGLDRGILARIGDDDHRFGALVVAPAGSSEQLPEAEAFTREIAELLAAAIRRERIEGSLRSSEQRLAMAQRIAHMGSYDWHIASNTNVWSDELYRIYGTEPRSFNASYERFLSFIHPDDREKIVAIHTKAYETGEPYEMEERIVRPDGEVRILKSNGEVITDEAGTPVRMVGICFDVTEQRAAEQKARRFHETQLARRQAFELNDGVVQGLATVVHALESERDELALEASRRTLRAARGMMNDLLSIATDEELKPGGLVRSDPPASVLDPEPSPIPDTARRASDAIRLVVADDSSDMRMMLRFGIGAEPGFALVGEAEDGEEAVRIVREQVPDVLLLDLAMPKMDGLEVIGAIREGTPATKIVVLSGFDAQRMQPLAMDAGADAYIEKGMPLASLKRVVAELVPDRPPVNADTLGEPPRPSAGPGPELLAHEMRTPVTVIESLVETVKGRTDRLPSSAMTELFEALGRNAALLTRLLNDFEDVLRLGEGQLTLRVEETRIAVLVHAVVRDLAAVFGDRRVMARVGDDLVATVDPFRVRQIMTNLLSNAAKFSPEGSTITIDARADGSDLVVRVADEGPGIPPDRRGELFQRFSRLGAGGPGLGLGLALSKGLALAHDGDLTLADTGDQPGATFELRLPLRVDDRARS